MDASPIDWLFFVTVTSAYLALAVRGARRAGRGLGEATIALVGALAIFFLRSGIDGTSLVGALRASGAALLVLIATRGQPARLFDLPGRKAKEIRRLPRSEREALTRQERDITISQVTFILAVAVLLGICVRTGITFLD